MQCVFTLTHGFMRMKLLETFEELILVWDDPLVGYCYYETFKETPRIQTMIKTVQMHNVRMNKLYRIIAIDQKPEMIDIFDDWTFVIALFLKKYQVIAKISKKQRYLPIEIVCEIICNRFFITKHEMVRLFHLLDVDHHQFMLHMVQYNYDPLISEVLIEYYHVDVNTVIHGRCPLYCAIVNNLQEHYQWLVDFGASTEIIISEPNTNQKTTLQEFIRKNI